MGVFCVGCIAASVCTLVVSVELKWRHNVAFDNILPVNVEVTSKVSAKSLVACATQCAFEEWCNSFFYNDVSGDCLRQRMVYEVPTNATSVSATSWRYYKCSSGGPQHFSDRLSGFHFRLDRNVTLTHGWYEGRENCQKRGEDLAVLEPVTKADFIHRYLLANAKGLELERDIHIGAMRPNASVPFPDTGPDFVWVNNQTLNMAATGEFWSYRKPLFIYFKPAIRLAWRDDFRWNEATNDPGKRVTLCEKPFLPN